MLRLRGVVTIGLLSGALVFGALTGGCSSDDNGTGTAGTSGTAGTGGGGSGGSGGATGGSGGSGGGGGASTDASAG